VLLGDEALHDLDAFNEHGDLFVDRDIVESRAEFHAIKWKGRVTDHVNQILENKLPPELESATTSSNVKRISVWKRLGRKLSRCSPAEEMKGE
jgi:SPX domain protein involved in polyphosphate accumulation